MGSPASSPFRSRTSARSSPVKNRFTPAAARRARTLPSRKTLLEHSRQQEERIWYDILLKIQLRLEEVLVENQRLNAKVKTKSKKKGAKLITVELDETKNAVSLINWLEEIF